MLPRMSRWTISRTLPERGLADAAKRCFSARLNGTTTEASQRATSSGASAPLRPRGYSAEMASSSTTAVQQFDLTP